MGSCTQIDGNRWLAGSRSQTGKISKTVGGRIHSEVLPSSIHSKPTFHRTRRTSVPGLRDAFRNEAKPAQSPCCHLWDTGGRENRVCDRILLSIPGFLYWDLLD